MHNNKWRLKGLIKEQGHIYEVSCYPNETERFIISIKISIIYATIIYLIYAEVGIAVFPLFFATKPKFTSSGMLEEKPKNTTFFSKYNKWCIYDHDLWNYSQITCNVNLVVYEHLPTTIYFLCLDKCTCLNLENYTWLPKVTKQPQQKLQLFAS